MKIVYSWLCVATVGLALAQANAQDPPKPPVSMKQLGVTDAVATKSAREAAMKAGQAADLDKIVDRLNLQLMDAFHNTRKFAVIARSDLAHIMKEQAIPVDLIINPADPNRAMPGKIKGLNYLVVTTVDECVYTYSGRVIEGLGMMKSRQEVKVSAVVRLYDSSTARMLEITTIPVARTVEGTSRVTPGSFSGTPKVDANPLFDGVATEIAQRAAMRVVDVVYPARIAAMAGDVITVNRGDGTGIAPEQVWEVYSVGEVIKDPDTGEEIGREEVKVAEIAITDVLPKFSKARLLSETRGVGLKAEVGAIVRPKRESQPRPSN